MTTDADKTLVPELEKMLGALAAQRINRPAATHPRMHAPRRGSRVLGVALASLAVSGTALAAVNGWNPLIGDAGPGGAPTLSGNVVPLRMKSALGVLRESSPLDHGAEVEATLHGVGRDVVSGVRTDSIRYLAPGPDGHASILLVVDQADAPGAATLPSGGGNAADWSEGEVLCVYRGEGSSDCFHLVQVLAGEAVASISGPHLSVVSGLVPDGVATVSARLSDGNTERVAVENNFYEIESHAGIVNPDSVSWHNAHGGVIEARVSAAG